MSGENLKIMLTFVLYVTRDEKPRLKFGRTKSFVITMYYSFGAEIFRFPRASLTLILLSSAASQAQEYKQNQSTCDVNRAKYRSSVRKAEMSAFVRITFSDFLARCSRAIFSWLCVFCMSWFSHNP